MVGGLTSFNNNNNANFPDGKKVQWRIPGYLFFDNTWKNSKSNFVLVVILNLESKGL